MSPELAVSMAIPFGLLGTLTINLSKVFSSFAASRCDKAAEERKRCQVPEVHLGYAAGFWSIFGIIPVTLINYFGPSAVTSVVNAIPERLVTGLTVAGGLMPALGFAMTVRVHWKKKLFFHSFFLGFLSGKYFNLHPLDVLSLLLLHPLSIFS